MLLAGGIVMAVFGVVSLLAAADDPRPDPAGTIFAVLVLVGGISMIYFAVRGRARRNSVLRTALILLRENGKIACDDLAHRAGVDEIEARLHLAYGQRVGIIPLKAEID